MRKTNSFLTDEEAVLWQKATKDVRPLFPQRKKTKRLAPAPAPAIKQTAVRKPAAGNNESPAAAPDEARQPLSDWRTGRNLKKGKIAIEARLDLHGMTQAEAHKALSCFISAGRERGHRCVLVITGKGRGPGRGLALDGVLRAMVPKWLGQLPNRGQIISYAQAAPRDGGEGALYVLLKKKRG